MAIGNSPDQSAKVITPLQNKHSKIGVKADVNHFPNGFSSVKAQTERTYFVQSFEIKIGG